MCSWHITRVFLNGATLHDYDPTHIYNSAMNASSQRVHSRVWAYKRTCVRREPDATTKREYMISTHVINEVSNKVCCQNNCVQQFPRAIVSLFDLPNVVVSGPSKIWKESFLEYAPKARGDSFARYGQCDNFKQLRSACTPGSYARKVWTNQLDAHIAVQRAH